MGIKGFWNPSAISIRVICTAATRPSGPVEGQKIYETDTDLEYVYDGSTWIPVTDIGTSTTWTPTLTQVGSLTLSTALGYYTVTGNVVTVSFTAIPSSAGTVGNPIFVGGIPSAIQSTLYGTHYALSVAVGSATILDAGTTWYQGSIVMASVSTFALQAHSNAAFIGQLPSFALASGDRVMGTAQWFLR